MRTIRQPTPGRHAHDHMVYYKHPNYRIRMSLHTDIKSSLKEAMKAKDAVRLGVVRNIISELTNQLVATKRTPQDELTDEEVLAVIKRLAKQRQDSIEQYQAAGRTESAEAEQAELAILQEYLPQMMSQDEIRPIAQAKQTELGITDKSQMGKLVGAIMQEVKGQADGADVKAVVEELF